MTELHIFLVNYHFKISDTLIERYFLSLAVFFSTYATLQTASKQTMVCYFALSCACIMHGKLSDHEPLEKQT